MAEPASFLVCVCQVGAERALKQELAREHPSLRSSFARPGLVTFKETAGAVAADRVLASVFARAWAVALGPAASTDEILQRSQAVAPGRPLRLHVFARDTHRPGEEPPEVAAATSALVRQVESELRAAGGERFLPEAAARGRDPVLDVIVAPGEPHFVAHHLHGRGHSPFPGGQIPVEVPPEAPSRAYRKLEEAIAWSGAKLVPGQVALEIGSAPGGASWALLRRGLTVHGVDPGAMDPVVMAHPAFHHLALPVGALTRELLPRHVDWLLLDVNLAPQIALRSVRGVVSALRPSLRGVLFTLKLNDWAMAERVPELLRRVTEMGLTSVRATQLPGNRQEILVYAERAAKPPTRKPR